MGQVTKKQHFIPRMILKHYAYFQIPMRKPLIYQFDKRTNISRLVDIYDICYKKNIYEFHNADGTINESSRNFIETIFSDYELIWDRILNQAINHNTISDGDFHFLYTLFTFQILRLPNIQKSFVQSCQAYANHIGKTYSPVEIENWVKQISLPTRIIWNDDNILINTLLTKLCNKDLSICYSDDVFVLNGDFPVIVYGKSFDCDFPVAPHVCLRLRDNYYHNRCIYISRNETRKINNWSTNILNGRFIYSSVPYNQILNK